VNEAMRIAGRHLSLDAPMNTKENSENNLLDLIQDSEEPSPDDDVLTESLKVDLEVALNSLSNRDSLH